MMGQGGAVDWLRESRQFDRMADYYDRFRPVYPEALVDALAREAGLRPGSRVLEAGAGSGKATAQLAARGYAVDCVEPGEALCRAGRARFAGKAVTFTAARFEEYMPEEGAYDLVFCAQAWHWVGQPGGWRAAARALRPGGSLGILYNLAVFPDGAEGRELADLNARCGMGGMAPEAAEGRVAALARDMEDSGLFSAPRIFREMWRQDFTADGYYGLALTGNSFVQRDDAAKEAARQEIARLAESRGGAIQQPYLAALHVAGKR